MKINPILIKEMKIRARTLRIPILVMMYVVLMTFGAVFMMLSSVDLLGYGGHIQYYALNDLMAVLGSIQCFMVCLVTLLTSSGSFSNEKERGTLDFLLMTPVRSFEVVNGKLFSSILTGCLFAFAAMPVLALCTIYGGSGVEDMLFLVAVIIILAFLCSSIGICSSVLMERTSMALVLSIAIFILVCAVPFLMGDVLSSFFYNGIWNNGVLTVLVLGLLMTDPLMLIYGYCDRVAAVNLVMDELVYHYGMEMDSGLYVLLEEHFLTGCVMMQCFLILIFVAVSVWALKKMRNVK